MPFPDWFPAGQDEVTFLRRLLDHVSDCLVVIDTEGRVVLINEPYCRLLGGDQADFIGRHITDVVSRNTKLHQVAKGVIAAYSGPLETRGHRLFTRQVQVRQNGQIIGAVGMALFSSLAALKKAVSFATKQELFVDNSLGGWAARHSLDDIAGTGAAMEVLRERIRKAAEQSHPLLIHGESGSGKDLAANAVHAYSSRSRRPFVWINCASIPESLIESELFGYEGGAFTGASSRGKRGKFEIASGGTLFLDEIGDMPVHLQANLLRAIQNQEIIRVGGTSPVSIDTRIICATNRPLQELVRTGAFRLDLYYRLNVFEIRMPALRERDDLEYLIEYLLKRIAQRENCPIRKLPPSVLAKFLTFSWPGNVRQLESALLRFLISGETDLDSDLDVDVEPLGSRTGRAASMNLQRHLDRQREAQIDRALSMTGHDKDEAARLLGISRATLYRELRRFSPAAR